MYEILAVWNFHCTKSKPGLIIKLYFADHLFSSFSWYSHITTAAWPKQLLVIVSALAKCSLPCVVQQWRLGTREEARDYKVIIQCDYSH